jgi:hypothetical protein
MNLPVFTVLCFEILNFHAYIADVPYLSFGRYGQTEGRKRGSCAAGRTLRCEPWCRIHDYVFRNCVKKPTKINMQEDTS